VIGLVKMSIVQLLRLKLVGLTKITSPELQFQDTLTGLTPPDPEKVKVPFWQGIDEMTIFTEPPGDRVPLDGLKLTPLRLLLADQFALP
jgi:hypothetical protein